MSSDLLDMAIVCKEAAKTFVENMDGFEIVDEAVMNSDIFITNPKVKEVNIVGMTQDRDYQMDLIKKKFGEDVEIAPLMVTALPYALAKGNVDAIIIDLMKGIHLDGIKEDTLIDGDYSTYVLVVSSKFKNTRDYKTFLKIYNKTLMKLLDDEELMKKHFLEYTKGDLEEGGLDKWGTKLLYLREE